MRGKGNVSKNVRKYTRPIGKKGAVREVEVRKWSSFHKGTVHSHDAEIKQSILGGGGGAGVPSRAGEK